MKFCLLPAVEGIWAPAYWKYYLNAVQAIRLVLPTVTVINLEMDSTKCFKHTAPHKTSESAFLLYHILLVNKLVSLLI